MTSSHGETMAYGMGGLLCLSERRPEGFRSLLWAPMSSLWWLRYCRLPETTVLMHFCHKIERQRVCTFLREQLPLVQRKMSPTKQRKMSLCGLDAVTRVTSWWRPHSLPPGELLVSHCRSPTLHVPALTPACPPLACILLHDVLSSGFLWSRLLPKGCMRGCYGWKPLFMLPSFILCPWRVVVTKHPSLVARGAPPEWALASFRTKSSPFN